MAKLSLWLPPFSPDYSGVSAVLFDLNTVTAMHDASGCTGNYTGYDDPRWYGSQSGIFCSGLRRIDAILGGDDKLIEKMLAAAKDLKPDILALVGSPVPMVIGTDLKGIAAELEQESGIPSFGFDTTGTQYYDRGAYKAAKALIDRFTEVTEKKDRRVNILGATPMDFGNGEEIDSLKAVLSNCGYETGLCLAMGYTLDDIKGAAAASVNLAISRFGYLTAKYMEKKFGIPYVAGFPAGEKGEQKWLAAIDKTHENGISVNVCADSCGKDLLCQSVTVLIIGEQVKSNSIRIALKEDMGYQNVTVGCLYGIEKELAEEGDLDLTTEHRIKDAVNDPKYGMIIADPFLKILLDEDSGCKFISLSQYAVSSKLGTADSACISGEDFNKWFKRRNTE